MGEQAKPRRRDRGAQTARAQRDLAGAGPSRLSPSRAARARDVNRPSEQDLADAEDEVVIERRHWKP